MSNTSLLGSYGGIDGSALMFRNRIINGDMRIAQYGNVALANNTVKYGGCDRTAAVPIGFTTATGTVLQSTFAGSTSGKGQFVTLTTTGTGTVVFVQRVESQNVNDLNSKSVTFSGKIAHDIGTTQSVIVRITKANALDNFNTVTLISQQTISVPSGVTTSFTLTALLGATDASNGLGVEIEFNLGAISNKNMGVSDLQLEAGSVATPFERRPIGTELALCQRYYEKSYDLTVAPANNAVVDSRQGIATILNNTELMSCHIPFKVTKRTGTPSVTTYKSSGPSGGVNGNWHYYAGAGWQAFSVGTNVSQNYWMASGTGLSGVTNGQSFILSGGWSAEAEL